MDSVKRKELIPPGEKGESGKAPGGKDIRVEYHSVSRNSQGRQG